METVKCKCGSDHIICEMRGGIIRVYCDNCGEFVDTETSKEEPERKRLKRAVAAWNEEQKQNRRTAKMQKIET